jgi:hypothetical protein
VLDTRPVLFVVGNTTLGTGDVAVRDLLLNMGHTVTIRQAAASTTADATGMGLVVVSSTVVSADVNTKFRDVAVPVMTWEPAIYDDMWMVGTAGGQQGNVTLTTVDIAAASHPIAAGRTGSPSLYTSSQANNAYGIIGGGGVKVAGVPGSSTQSAIFAYEAGVAMVGGNAPARRVGFSLSDATYPALTVDGLAMFQAAVIWAREVVSAPTAPSITTQPASQTVTVGQSVTFSVVATGTAPLTYQWRENGAPIAGATSASYTISNPTTGHSGRQYSVVVTNSVNSVTSANAILTVNPAGTGPVITTQPASQTVDLGAEATFTVVASGTGLSYQWRRNGTNISGATSASYTTPATVLGDNGAQFTVAVSNSSGSTSSDDAILGIRLFATEVNASRITATELVTTPNWEIPDYVFEKDYRLRSLPELERYLAEHKHLPEVPSASQIKHKGMNMGEMDVKLLKNLEELTLHVIGLHKEMQAKDRRFERQLDSLRTLLKTR